MNVRTFSLGLLVGVVLGAASTAGVAQWLHRDTTPSLAYVERGVGRQLDAHYVRCVEATKARVYICDWAHNANGHDPDGGGTATVLVGGKGKRVFITDAGVAPLPGPIGVTLPHG